ncbi:unnamed protein product [Trichogramma brassicae]|uniref:Uncharacterized protein n=1 Tax=Trichogramma brassicae TaxID=86971 RepID=A0A6H5IIR8_9HYME|nr:unnamed protein product [Trichogramma brassicae]
MPGIGSTLAPSARIEHANGTRDQRAMRLSWKMRRVLPTPQIPDFASIFASDFDTLGRGRAECVTYTTDWYTGVHQLMATARDRRIRCTYMYIARYTTAVHYDKNVVAYIYIYTYGEHAEMKMLYTASTRRRLHRRHRDALHMYLLLFRNAQLQTSTRTHIIRKGPSGRCCCCCCCCAQASHAPQSRIPIYIYIYLHTDPTRDNKCADQKRTDASTRLRAVRAHVYIYSFEAKKGTRGLQAAHQPTLGCSQREKLWAPASSRARGENFFIFPARARCFVLCTRHEPCNFLHNSYKRHDDRFRVKVARYSRLIMRPEGFRSIRMRVLYRA